MAWIESHQTLRDHPKLKRLARKLAIPEVQACGHLHFLWWWALDYAPDGDVSRFDELDLAIAAAWIAEPEPFVQALKECGWLDGDRHTIHDWHDYCGKLIERKERNRERMRAARAPHVQRTDEQCAAHVQRTDDARDAHVQDTQRARVQLPNQTKPNQTRPDLSESAPTAVAAEQAAAAPAPVPAIRPVPKPRATRLPADFEPDQRLLEYATDDLGMTATQVLNETEKFRDHFLANGKTMTDWSAAWRNWMRRSGEFAPRPARPSAGRPVAVNPFTQIREQREATSASFDDAIDVEYAER